MGWLALAVTAVASAAALWRLRFPAELWRFVAAALMLSAAGYAWQGRPQLGEQRARPAAPTVMPDVERYALREAMLGRFGGDVGYVAAADAMTRAGAPGAAVRAVQGGIGKYPSSVRLWIEFGTTLAAHDKTLSPPAKFAFRHAIALAPNDPAPWFFLGLAQVRSGAFADARTNWRRAFNLTARDTPVRKDIAVRLMLLERYVAAN